MWAVVEAVRGVACVGALPLAITDCLNYGDPEDPGVFWEFREGVRGIGDACRGLRVFPGADHGVPVVSGNVSFYNQSETGDAIAPTPIVACAGRVDDASRARGHALRRAGSRIVLLGALHDRIGGSEYERIFGDGGGEVPRPDLAQETALVRALVDGVGRGVILSAHDVSHGGVLVAVAEMVMASAPFDVGARLSLGEALAGGGDAARRLFSEYAGVLVEIDDNDWETFEKMLDAAGVAHATIGRASDDTALEVDLGGDSFRVGADELRGAHRGRIEEILYG
jgi:phosphoribosylformylglycinamidine synthase